MQSGPFALPFPVALALSATLALAGCLVTATQPPDPAAPSPTATPDAPPPDPPAPDPTAAPTASPAPDPTSSPDPATGPQRCGSRGHPACPVDHFCDFPPDSQCGATDRGGVCKLKPDVCTREFHQVCGCDGQTHPNPCAANAKGISIAHDGPC